MANVAGCCPLLSMRTWNELFTDAIRYEPGGSIRPPTTKSKGTFAEIARSWADAGMIAKRLDTAKNVTAVIIRFIKFSFSSIHGKIIEPAFEKQSLPAATHH